MRDSRASWGWSGRAECVLVMRRRNKLFGDGGCNSGFKVESWGGWLAGWWTATLGAAAQTRC